MGTLKQRKKTEERMALAKEIESCVLIPEESDFLVKYAEKAKHGLVELGSLYGRSSVILGDVAERNNLKLYCVDIWEDFPVLMEWRNNITKANLTSSIKGLQHNTLCGAFCCYKLHYLSDFLFIDADHAYGSVKADFEAWEPILTRPAYVVFHDVNMGSVRKYFDEIKDNYEHEILNNIAMIKLNGQRRE